MTYGDWAGLILVVVLGADLVVLCGALGRLPSNPFVGIRSARTRASKRTWLAAHRASLIPTLLLSLPAVTLLVIALFAPEPSASVFVGVATILAIIAGVTAIVIGERAAAQLEEGR